MKRFLYAIEADTSRWANWVKEIPDQMNKDQIADLKSRFEVEAGEKFVIFDSAERTEFVPNPAAFREVSSAKGTSSGSTYLITGAAKSIASAFKWSDKREIEPYDRPAVKKETET